MIFLPYRLPYYTVLQTNVIILYKRPCPVARNNITDEDRENESEKHPLEVPGVVPYA